MAKFADFRAMAVRAALATGSDGIVFSNSSVDDLEREWEALDEETRTNWRDLAELLFEILVHPLTSQEQTDITITH